LESGEIFDLTDESIAKKENIHNSNFRYKPLPVVVGAGLVIKGLDEELTKMNVGEEKEVVVSPEKGFGQRDPNMIRIVPEKSFGDKKPQPGMIIDFGQLKGRVQSITAGRVRVDFNHPLAGKTLKYTVKILEKIESPDFQAKAILEFFGADANIAIKNNIAEIHEIPKIRDDKELRMTPDLKHRIADMIMEYVKEVNEVQFIESFKPHSHKHE